MLPMSFDSRDQVDRRDVLGLLAMSTVGLATGTSIGSAHAEQQPAKGPLRTIGVLGGLGPQATMDLEVRVYRIAQRPIPQRENSGYPPMVVYYHRHPPILLNDDSSPRLPIQPIRGCSMPPGVARKVVMLFREVRPPR